MAAHAYSRYERTHPTTDSDGPPWVACDESGQDGENLVATNPVLSHGSVRADDVYADEVTAVLTARLRHTQSSELKFRAFDRPLGASTLAWALGEDGPLHSRARIYLAHKPYVATGKVIDLLIEETEHAQGRDIYSSGEARVLARTLFRDGPRALGRDEFEHLIKRFVGLFRAQQPDRTGGKETVDGFFAAIEAARWRSSRRSVEQVLRRIIAARSHAEAFQVRLAAIREGDLPALDPLVPTLAQTLRYWSNQPGMSGARFLHDRQNLLTDGRIDTVLRAVKTPLPEFLRLAPPTPVGELVRGDSAHHASVQLADIVAGAGRAAAEFALRVRTDPTAGVLMKALRPSIAEESLWADDVSWERLTGRRSA
jgi:hypothetical protein